MKTLKSLFILTSLSLGTNVLAQNISMPSFSDIKTIKLHTGKLLDVKKEVNTIQLAMDRNNKVDYVELLEGSIIDSYDIDKIIFKQPHTHLNESFYLNTFMLSRVLGDGSGG